MYDCLAESLRLLEGAPVSCRARLSRRVRHLPLAVDWDTDVPATMFLRRGVSGVPLVDIHTLEMVGGRWRLAAEVLNDAGAVLGTVSLRRGGLRRPLP